MRYHTLTEDGAQDLTTLQVESEPVVQIVTIEPTAATMLLNANTKNRRISEPRVRAIMATLMNGRWLLSDSAIVIDTDGLVVNGAHRLTACERTKIPITVLFLQGVPPETRDIIDTGMKRNFGQALTIKGELNVTALAATTALHYLYTTKKLTPLGPVRETREVLSHDLLLAHLAEHPEVRYAVKDASSANWFLPNVKRSAVSTFRAITHALDEYAAAEFYDTLKHGEGLFPGMPILTLRNFLTRADKQTSRFVTLGVMIKAWNAFRDEEDMKSVSLRGNEKFPEAK